MRICCTIIALISSRNTCNGKFLRLNRIIYVYPSVSHLYSCSIFARISRWSGECISGIVHRIGDVVNKTIDRITLPICTRCQSCHCCCVIAVSFQFRFVDGQFAAIYIIAGISFCTLYGNSRIIGAVVVFPVMSMLAKLYTRAVFRH